MGDKLDQYDAYNIIMQEKMYSWLATHHGITVQEACDTWGLLRNENGTYFFYKLGGNREHPETGADKESKEPIWQEGCEEMS